MSAITDKLEARSKLWRPEVAAQVDGLVNEIIELADADALDISQSREVQQEVLDMIDS